LQGLIQWAGAENVMREIAAPDDAVDVFALDMRRVYSINEVARRMIVEALRRLEGEGKRVVLLDPEDTMGCAGSGSALPDVEIVDSPKELRNLDLRGLRRVRDDFADQTS
ncbi:glutaminase, partial [Geobacillus sp. MMMUD3]|nr:glutaminase [Geobacillus sp. MMMUD3]